MRDATRPTLSRGDRTDATHQELWAAFEELDRDPLTNQAADAA